MAVKRKGARLGARVAPKAGRYAGRAAWRAGKAEARLARRALSSQEPTGARLFKYAVFALAGFAVGAALARAKGGTSSESSSFTGGTGQHSPAPGSPAAERGQTWGTGTPVGTAGGGAGGDTGADRAHSDPSAGPLIGEQHRGRIGDVPVQQEELANKIRTRIGEDPRTMEMPHLNVEVNDGVAELRGPAPSEEAKRAAGEIAASIEGVREVRNLITVNG
ncbi:MAG: BON domain-containing protein [Actinomycetota bacterium]